MEKNNSKNQSNQAPSVAINAQYLKDLSFESPNSPSSLAPKKEAPKIDVSLNLEAREVEANNFEVVIQITAKSTSGNDTIFITELKYAGLFTLTNIPDEQKELVLLIHCPTILFPFARRIIADTTRDGGFMPLMIDPIDFNSLYMQRKDQEKEEAATIQ